MWRVVLVLFFIVAVMAGQVGSALPDEPWFGAPHDDTSNDVPAGVAIQLIAFILFVATAAVMAASIPWRIGIPAPARISRSPPLL